MRRTIVHTGYLIVLLGYFSNTASAQDQLPTFAFPDHEGTKLTDQDFRNDRQLIIFYYEPTCAHCQLEAEWIASKIDEFIDVDMLWVAWEPTNEIADFKLQYFPQSNNVYYAIDDEGTFDELFGFSQIPTIFIYNSLNELVKKFKKETKADKLLKVLDSSKY